MDKGPGIDTETNPFKLNWSTTIPEIQRNSREITRTSPNTDQLRYGATKWVMEPALLSHISWNAIYHNNGDTVTTPNEAHKPKMSFEIKLQIIFTGLLIQWVPTAYSLAMLVFR